MLNKVVKSEEGIMAAEATLNTAIATAKNLLRMNLLTPEQISQAVSLPLEQVLALRDELSKEMDVQNIG